MIWVLFTLNFLNSTVKMKYRTFLRSVHNFLRVSFLKKDWFTLFLFQEGNEFGDVFDELQYVQTQIMIIKLKVEEPKIVFEPPFREIRDIILRCFSEIIASGEGLTRVGNSLVWHVF